MDFEFAPLFALFVGGITGFLAALILTCRGGRSLVRWFVIVLAVLVASSALLVGWGELQYTIAPFSLNDGLLFIAIGLMSGALGAIPVLTTYWIYRLAKRRGML